MKRILLVLVLISLVACNNKFEPEPEAEPSAEATVDTVTPAIIALMQGSYNSCRASTIYGGYYNRVGITVTGSLMVVEYELSASATCATKYYRNTYSYNISKAAYKTDGDTETVLIDAKSVSTVIQWNHAWYVAQNYCGLNDWAINVNKDVTGLACLDLISTYDSFHSSFPALDELIYMEMQVKASGLVYPLGTDASGDSASDRLNTEMFEAAEIP